MKLILSRKGFDTANGGCPSPIFPDDTMFSLPIPEGKGPVTYGKLRHCSETLGKINIGKVVEDLTPAARRIGAKDHAHMSPDLNPPNGWPQLFDQVKAAKGHLRKQGVTKGDLFLFFGLFQRVEKDAGGTWQPICKPRHVLWGWLQVGEIHDRKEGADKLRCSCGSDNTRYVARKKLNMGDGLDGAGVFRFDERLLLTDPGQDGVTHWRLPNVFHPHPPKTPLTYHGKRVWTPEGDYTYVQRNGPGQEFVLDLDRDKYDGVKDWAMDLIAKFRAK